MHRHHIPALMFLAIIQMALKAILVNQLLAIRALNHKAIQIYNLQAILALNHKAMDSMLDPLLVELQEELHIPICHNSLSDLLHQALQVS